MTQTFKSAVLAAALAAGVPAPGRSDPTLPQDVPVAAPAVPAIETPPEALPKKRRPAARRKTAGRKKASGRTSAKRPVTQAPADSVLPEDTTVSR